MAIALTALMMMKNFFALAKTLGNLVAAHNPRASQIDPNAIPSLTSQVDPNAISHPHHHLHTCGRDNSRLNIGVLAMAVKPFKTPAD
jgi:calcineurin-like phosphoesterase family protein